MNDRFVGCDISASGFRAYSYPLIEQRRNFLPRDLNDKLESDSDESIIENIRHDNTINHKPINAYKLNRSFP